jgi:hypothetical protein
MCAVHGKPMMILTSSNPEFNLFRIGLLLGLSYDEHVNFDVISPNVIHVWFKAKSRKHVEMTLEAGQKWFYHKLLKAPDVTAFVEENDLINIYAEENRIVNITRL